MTMNDHEGEGEGSRNDHVVRWTEIFCTMYFVSDKKMVVRISFLSSYMTNLEIIMYLHI